MITHLQSYQIRDFVLFSQEILFGIYETYNLEIWPMQIGHFLLALLIVPLNSRSSRGSALILALMWFWIGFIFHLKYFQEINWAARYYGWMFLMEGALLMIFGVFFDKLSFVREKGGIKTLGLTLFYLSLFVPISLFFHQEIRTVMLFGWGPDQTALGTIGLLLLVKSRKIGLLLLIPCLLWLIISSLTYMGLK